jgi:hypothetical protein
MFYVAMGCVLVLFVFQFFIGYKINVLIDKIIEKKKLKNQEQLIESHKSKARLVSNIENSKTYSSCYVVYRNNSDCQKKTCSFSSIVIPDSKKKEILMSSLICCGCGNYINNTNSELYKKQITCKCD